MSKKTRTVDVDDEQVYEELKRRAARDRRTLKAYVNLVLEAHCGMSLAPSGVVPGRSVGMREATGSSRPTADELRATMNAVKPGSILSPKEIARERESHRGDYENENQDPEDTF